MEKFAVKTVEQQLSEQTQQRRFQTSLISLFSVIAVLLSAIGVYGVMQYFVTQRRHEIGAGLALGANRESVLVLVVRQGLSLSVAGIAIEICCALAFAAAQPGLQSHPRPL